jgi:hypothetical protein
VGTAGHHEGSGQQHAVRRVDFIADDGGHTSLDGSRICSIAFATKKGWIQVTDEERELEPEAEPDTDHRMRVIDALMPFAHKAVINEHLEYAGRDDLDEAEAYWEAIDVEMRRMLNDTIANLKLED